LEIIIVECNKSVSSQILGYPV